MSPGFFTLSATRAASVKASLTPRFFMAEHSISSVSIREQLPLSHSFHVPKYRKAFIFCATFNPCLYSIIGLLGSLSASAVSSSSLCLSRRSHFNATRTNLTPGQFSSISCFHFVSMFSRESAESTWGEC